MDLRAPSPESRAGSQGLPGLPVAVVLVVLLAVGVAVQVVRDRRVVGETGVPPHYLYVSSGEVLQRLALGHRALLADVYWIRALQHYGGTKLSEAEDKRYDLLFPLLDITTTLDPYFNIAYRFGAIFLTEAYPDGPGRPDQAVALLSKGLQHRPDRWQYMMDIGFVYYWWLHDFTAAADWFQKAAAIEGAPWWLRPLAATTLVHGGERSASRMLWQQLHESAENDWLRGEAQRRLLQLAALDEIDRLDAVVRMFRAGRDRNPRSWTDLLDAGYLPAIPLDPAGHPYVLDPAAGRVEVSRESPLVPLPLEPAGLQP